MTVPPRLRDELSTRPQEVAAVAELRDAIGYTGYVYDPRLDGAIRRLAELSPDVRADVITSVQFVRDQCGDHY